MKISAIGNSLVVYTRESSFDQIPAHRNLFGRCTIAVSPVLSPSSSLPPPASHFAFIPAQFKFRGVLRPYHFCFFFYILLNSEFA